MSGHEETIVKVNARVDKGIAPLIATLSEFHGLETIESCQGSDSVPAWVCFRFGDYRRHPWRDLAKFVFDHLGPALAQGVGDSANVRIQVTGSGLIVGELSVRPGQLNAVWRCLRRLLKRYRAPRP